MNGWNRVGSVALVGVSGMPNFGDEAVLRAANRFLSQQLPGVHRYVFSQCPAITEQLHPQRDGVTVCGGLWRFVYRRLPGTFAEAAVRAEEFFSHDSAPVDAADYQEICQVVDQSELIHFIGGGYFSRDFTGSALAALVLARLARQMNKPLAFTGHTIGPYDQESLAVLLPVLRQAAMVDMRDASEFENLASWDVPARVSCDDLFLDLPEIRLRAAEFGGGPPRIVICLQNQFLDEASLGRLVGAMAQFLRRLGRRSELAVTFLEMMPGVDDAVYRRLAAETAGEVEIELAPFDELMREPARWLNASTLCTIGTRFHLAVLSLACGIPALSLVLNEYYRRKLCGIHECFQSREVLDASRLTAEDLVDFFDRANRADRGTLANLAVPHHRRKQAVYRRLYLGEACRPKRSRSFSRAL